MLTCTRDEFAEFWESDLGKKLKAIDYAGGGGDNAPSESLEAGPSQPSKRKRELDQLGAPFSWDKRNRLYPANEDAFYSSRNQNTRFSVVPATVVEEENNVVTTASHIQHNEEPLSRQFITHAPPQSEPKTPAPSGRVAAQEDAVPVATPTPHAVVPRIARVMELLTPLGDAGLAPSLIGGYLGTFMKFDEKKQGDHEMSIAVLVNMNVEVIGAFIEATLK